MARFHASENLDTLAEYVDGRNDDRYLVYKLGTDIADVQGLEIVGWREALCEFRKGGFIGIRNLDRDSSELTDGDGLTEDQQEMVRVADEELHTCSRVTQCSGNRSHAGVGCWKAQSDWRIGNPCVDGPGIHDAKTLIPSANTEAA